MPDTIQIWWTPSCRDALVMNSATELDASTKQHTTMSMQVVTSIETHIPMFDVLSSTLCFTSSTLSAKDMVACTFPHEKSRQPLWGRNNEEAQCGCGWLVRMKAPSM